MLSNPEKKIPFAYSRGLYGVPEVQSSCKVGKGGVQLLSFEKGPTSWYVPIKINGQSYVFLIDSGASTSVISHKVYNFVPKPIPPIQRTNMKFTVANDHSIRTSGPYLYVICHQVLIVFLASMSGFVLCFGTGIWCCDDANCLPSMIKIIKIKIKIVYL